MKELVFKITSETTQLESFFHRYTLFFNEYYRHRPNRAYFETIDHGFLYILPDLETYHRIAESVPGPDAILRLLETHQTDRHTLAEELLQSLGFPPTEKVLLNVEVTPYTTKETLPLMQKIFLSINRGIKFTPVDEHQYRIKFPHMDAFIDYYTVFLLTIRTK